jgi:hypothetical protein
MLLFVPFQKFTVKKKRRNQLTLFILVSFALIFYSFAIFTTNNSDSNRCQPIDEWFNFVKIMSLIDSIITIILPFLLVLIINLAIIIKMIKYKKSKDLQTNNNNNNKATSRVSRFDINLVSIDAEKEKGVRNETSILKSRNNQQTLDLKEMRNKTAIAESLTLNINEINEHIRSGSFNSKIEIIRRKKVYWRMTHILLAITTSFLILNFPFCFLKLRYFIRGFASITKTAPHPHSTNQTTTLEYKNVTPVNQFKESMDASQIDELIERVTYYIYYLNFSINFILFAFSVSKSKLKIKLSKL